jgi:peptide/nickel transport system permease protein
LINLLIKLEQEIGAIYLFIDWITGFVSGDWGDWRVSRMEVRSVVMGRIRKFDNAGRCFSGFVRTLRIPLGIIAALKEDHPIDQPISSISMAFVGLPDFVTRLTLPAITVSLTNLEYIARMS